MSSKSIEAIFDEIKKPMLKKLDSILEELKKENALMRESNQRYLRKAKKKLSNHVPVQI